jgi:hypothetical protein
MGWWLVGIGLLTIIFGYRGRPATGPGLIVLGVGAALLAWKWIDPGRDPDNEPY